MSTLNLQCSAGRSTLATGSPNAAVRTEAIRHNCAAPAAWKGHVIARRACMYQSRSNPGRFKLQLRCCDEKDPQGSLACSRRTVNLATCAMMAWSVGLSQPSAVLASPLGPMADRAWEAVGGGPADLYFPDFFMGKWQATSVLVKVETPLGEDYAPNQRSVQRAVQEDLNQPLDYEVSFVRGPEGRVIFDRARNIQMLLRAYYGDSLNMSDRIVWSSSNPNVLQLSMPNGLVMRTRVTRRSMKEVPGNRLETSEFLEEVFDDGADNRPRIKASQCFTKYKWRSLQDAIAAGGPPIVATQVVSEYLTPDDDSEKYIRAMNNPVVLYTYRLAFRPIPPPTAVLV